MDLSRKYSSGQVMFAGFIVNNSLYYDRNFPI